MTRRVIASAWSRGSVAMSASARSVSMRSSTDPVDGPAPAERDQPAAKGGLVAGEVHQPARHVDPHVGGDVLCGRRVVKKYAKVTKQRRMGVTPQHGERHLVATGSSVEHDPELALEHERHVTRTRRCASVNSTDAHRLSY